ncbi:Uncharacterised protein [uncultured archaeon]|nr:Uncharacterised protein [uncultured archaeon]
MRSGAEARLTDLPKSSVTVTAPSVLSFAGASEHRSIIAIRIDIASFGLNAFTFN